MAKINNLFGIFNSISLGHNTNSDFLQLQPTLDYVTEATVIYMKDGFESQEFDGAISEEIYYIPKYKKLLLQDQLLQFVYDHKEEKFILIDNDKGGWQDIWTYIDSQINNIALHFFKLNQETGTLTKIAYLHNVPEQCVWDPKSVSINKKFVSKFYSDSDNGQANYEMELSGKQTSSRYDHFSRFYLIGTDDTSYYPTTYIMCSYLKLPNKTRIISSVDYSEIAYKVTVGERAMLDPIKRYGINADGRSWYYDHIHFDETFDEKAELDDETKNRIKELLEIKVNSDAARRESIGDYNSRTNIYTSSIIVISGPIGNHRKPTYHYIKAFKNVGAIDVVELARGELFMKDMTPVNCYYLCDNGKYARISHTRFSQIKSDIIGSPVDPVTFAEWNEEKSIHPRLLAAVNSVGDKMDLTKVKLFNRVPFGSLFLEHLIKEAQYHLSESFAEYITQHADNMNYVCGSLNDILPGCDPEGTSLLKTLNINKTCLDLLMNHTGSVNNFSTAYRAIQTLVNNNLNKQTENLFNMYMFLYNLGYTTYNCGTGRVVDIINYPNEIKSIYKMYNKIKTAFPYNNWEPIRYYREILTAYFQFKDFGWDPAESQIFIEFGMGNPTETKEMLHDRERAANTALSIYQDKIDEMRHQAVEAKYNYRKTALSKLASTKTMAEKSKTGLLKKYSVTVPSQIYGVNISGSIEKEGRDMNHCVFRSYAGQIAEGKYTVLYLRYATATDRSLVTIGITNEGRINQTYGLNDSAITKEQAEAIVEWAIQRTGLVTFKSEHSNVSPGGWPTGVTIPSLPKPDKNWLIKLAQTE